MPAVQAVQAVHAVHADAEADVDGRGVDSPVVASSMMATADAGGWSCGCGSNVDVGAGVGMDMDMAPNSRCSIAARAALGRRYRSPVLGVKPRSTDMPTSDHPPHCTESVVSRCLPWVHAAASQSRNRLAEQ